MAKYKFEYKEFHRVICEQYEEFDTTDQNRWTELVNIVISNGDHDLDEHDLSESVSNNPQDWFKLYQLINPEEIKISKEPYWVTVFKGGYNIEYRLINENNEIIDVIKE